MAEGKLGSGNRVGVREKRRNRCTTYHAELACETCHCRPKGLSGCAAYVLFWF